MTRITPDRTKAGVHELKPITIFQNPSPIKSRPSQMGWKHWWFWLNSVPQFQHILHNLHITATFHIFAGFFININGFFSAFIHINDRSFGFILVLCRLADKLPLDKCQTDKCQEDKCQQDKCQQDKCQQDKCQQDKCQATCQGRQVPDRQVPDQTTARPDNCQTRQLPDQTSARPWYLSYWHLSRSNLSANRFMHASSQSVVSKRILILRDRNPNFVAKLN